jgi:DNA-binding NarL/FixJ family response regulator
MGSKPRVLIADDHQIVAQGVSRLIERDVEVVATAKDGSELVIQARLHRPDIVIADLTMPVMSGLDAMRRLRADGVRSKFIFLTLHAEPRLAADALRAGASAYLLKQAAGEELIEAIHAVSQGLTYLTPLITRDVLWAMAQPDDDQGPVLTSRQAEVLQQLATGKRMKEIAADLAISVRTVESHKQELMRTLGLASTADLVRFAIKQGLIPG